jgi:hypothetical protein
VWPNNTRGSSQRRHTALCLPRPTGQHAALIIGGMWLSSGAWPRGAVRMATCRIRPYAMLDDHVESSQVRSGQVKSSQVRSRTAIRHVGRPRACTSTRTRTHTRIHGTQGIREGEKGARACSGGCTRKQWRWRAHAVEMACTCSGEGAHCVCAVAVRRGHTHAVERACTVCEPRQ